VAWTRGENARTGELFLEENAMAFGILNDVTRCRGCKACSMACAEANGLPRAEVGDSLSDKRWTAIRAVGGNHVKQQCMHCIDPACVSVCPVGALQKTTEGPVVYDASRCIGCRYCMLACPFGVPTYEWHALAPKVRKCIMCADRVKQGKQPACTAVCPNGATVFGDREMLLAEARARFAASPSRYVPHIYGQHEVGGTSVLYLAGHPFNQLGFREVRRDRPMPELTWAVLSKLPNVVSVAAVGLVGIHWITKRREEVARAEGYDKPASPAAGDKTGRSS
jgi:formate dehydrogenase iron-sulfur subunit